MKLIAYFTVSDRKSLKNLLKNPGGRDFPTEQEVIDFLKETDYNGEPLEKVIGDLIIQYIEEEGVMFDVC